MNRSQNARLKRHQKYNQVLTEATAEIATVPAFADLVATYQQGLALLLPALGSQQRQTSAGATEIKDDLGTTLIPGVVRCASALLLLFKKKATSKPPGACTFTAPITGASAARPSPPKPPTCFGSPASASPTSSPTPSPPLT
ncbi:MAG: hypothetical protein WKG07_02745 [Hymenobacter sp.]